MSLDSIFQKSGSYSSPSFSVTFHIKSTKSGCSASYSAVKSLFYYNTKGYFFSSKTLNIALLQPLASRLPPTKITFHIATRLISKVCINDVILIASRSKFNFLDIAHNTLSILSLYFSDLFVSSVRSTFYSLSFT